MSGAGKAKKTEGIDALIVTAIKEEYDAVLKVDAGAWPGSQWEVRRGPDNRDVAFRVFRAANGQPLEMAVTWATEMGGVAATSTAERLVSAYSPRCIAMCGVCAGRRGDVTIGDVIIADRLWMYDAGKRKVELDEDGKHTERVQGDTLTYPLRPDWKGRAESFTLPNEANEWIATRPRTSEAQADWILERLYNGDDPRSHPERAIKAPNYGDVVQLLWKKKLLEDGTRNLTDAGRARIQRLLEMNPDGLPEPPPFKVRVGPIGSGNQVIEDPTIFDRLSSTMRTVRGLEMEAVAIGAVAHGRQDDIRHMIVIKAAMDHADGWKSEAVKSFAARASAECLLAFLRANLPPEHRFVDILSPGTSSPPATPSPAAFLNARHEYVPFYEPGRAAILEELRAFCEVPGDARAWLIHGEGGMGKTRLLIEACARMRTNGWAAGFLAKHTPWERFDQLINSGRPALVVVDYAESHPELRVLLARVAQARSSGRAGSLRLVLLARNAGIWWSELMKSDGPTKDLLMGCSPTKLPALVVSPSDRAAVVREAMKAFASIAVSTAASPPLPALDDDRFARVLYLHMAALALVSGISFKTETLMEEILDHEERFWVTRIKNDGDPLAEAPFRDDARRAVAALTLLGVTSGEERARSLLTRVNGVDDRRLLTLLEALYSGRREGASTDLLVTGLEPDLLGETMVFRALSHEHARGNSPERLIDRVFEGATERAFVSGFQVLGRLSEEHADATRPWIVHLLQTDLSERSLHALEAAKVLGAKTAHAQVGIALAAALEAKGTLDVARRLELAGVPSLTVSLCEVRAWVTWTLLGAHAGEAEDPNVCAVRAKRLNSLGVDQSQLGQREEALASTREAVELYRALVKAESDLFLPDLAASLDNLGSRQSALAQHEAALESTLKAVELYRNLVATRSNTFRSDLARSLNNLGSRQSALRQYNEALQSTCEAVELYRALDREHPDAFSPDLARGLNNLGNRQSELAQYEEALASAREAVKLRRALAKARPDGFLPALATSLNNLGSMQSALGQREDALASMREAVELYRALAKARPDAFLPDMATSLNNLASMQSALRHREEAFASAQEAVDVILPFVRRFPGAFDRYAGVYRDDARACLKALNGEPNDELRARLDELDALLNR